MPVFRQSRCGPDSCLPTPTHQPTTPDARAGVPDCTVTSSQPVQAGSMNNQGLAGVVAARAATPQLSWAAEDVVLFMLVPYALTLAVLLLCVPVMLVAWAF